MRVFRRTLFVTKNHRRWDDAICFIGKLVTSLKIKVSGRLPCEVNDLVIPSTQAIGSSLANGRASQRLPAATMQLLPLGVVLTTVQVFFLSEA